MLGNVYKLPPGIDLQEGESFLAGKKKDWIIEEVEIWSVQSK